MEHYTTIYLNENPLIIVASTPGIPEKYKDAALFASPDATTIEKTLQALENSELPAAVFVQEDTDAVLNAVKSNFKVMVAGGGLVVNQEEEVLLMFRRGKWDMPKGKQEKGEDIETCALREVTEETGLKSLQLEHKITETYHFYAFSGKRVLKHTHWFKMQFTGTELTVPQIEEDIVDIQWVKPEHLSKYMKFSYNNIIQVFEQDGYAISSL
jgi:8-oxo-dGTP pyrophosphatase MutT (NUDIX family)